MNIILFYTFEIGLLALAVIAVVFAFLEATRPDPDSDPARAEDNEPAQD
jgi:hypothetical protein